MQLMRMRIQTFATMARQVPTWFVSEAQEALTIVMLWMDMSLGCMAGGMVGCMVGGLWEARTVRAGAICSDRGASSLLPGITGTLAFGPPFGVRDLEPIS